MMRHALGFVAAGVALASTQAGAQMQNPSTQGVVPSAPTPGPTSLPSTGLSQPSCGGAYTAPGTAPLGGLCGSQTQTPLQQTAPCAGCVPGTGLPQGLDALP